MDPARKLRLVRRRAAELGLNHRINISSVKSKKYEVCVDDKMVRFGQAGASDYIEHRDKDRRERYLARACAIRNGKGKLTFKDKSSSNFWSIHILW